MYDIVVLSEEMAKEICAWRYPGEYAVYDFSPWEEAVIKGWSIADEAARKKEFRGVLNQQGSLIGFLRMSPLPVLPSQKEENKHQYTAAQLELGLGMHPDYCGRGLGKSFVEAVTAYAESQYPGRDIYMEVRCFNTRARRCYEAAGYRITAQYEKNMPWGKDNYYKMKQLEEIRNKIRRVEDQWKQIFSVQIPINEHLNRWKDQELVDMFDHNQFIPSVPVEKITADDLRRAQEYQADHMWEFLKFEAREKLLPEVCEKAALEWGETYTMALLDRKALIDWKTNTRVEIRDMKTTDIEEDIKSVELENYGTVYGEDFTCRRLRRYMNQAAVTEGFHYYGAYIDGKIQGACYAFSRDGFIQMDGLIINGSARHQYVATTMMKYIAEHLEGCVYLHAYEDDTPQEMYRKMGFEMVDSLYEYIKTA